MLGSKTNEIINEYTLDVQGQTNYLRIFNF